MGIAAAVMLTLLTLFGVQQWRIHSLRTEVAEGEVQLAKARVDLGKWQAAVVAQNDAIKRWAAEADARSKRAQAALDRATKERQAAQQRAQRLYSIVMTGDECADIQSVIDAARVGRL